VPVGAYGQLKLDQERLATKLLASTCPVVLARIANLYGPGQNLDKLQGLISRLAWCAARQEPANIFVPLDTIRDYIDSDDAARACLAALENVVDPVTVHVIASGRPVTVGQLIKLVSQVTRRQVPVALGTHASARDQVLDLRLQPSTFIEDPTPLPAGVKRVYLDILARIGASTALPA
jgi:UDP-glucose 4-epimerase